MADLDCRPPRKPNSTARFPKTLRTRASGFAVKVPRLNWVFRGFYGHYYQAPPLVTATGALLGLASSQNFSFRSLCTASGTKNTSLASGFPIAAGPWTPITSTPRPTNWLDHNNIGESNLFWPITWDAAVIQGLGTHAALAQPVASRPLPPRLFQPNRGGNFTHYRRSDLRSPTGVFARRPRPEQHPKLRIQHQPSLAGLCFDQRLLRLGVHQWPVRHAAGAISRAVSACPRHGRPGGGEDFRREISPFP